MDRDFICERKKCTGCSLCTDICPKKCITMEENSEGFLYPQIDNTKCINCGACKKMCPINRKTKTEDSTFYMAINKDKDTLLNSSSGGAFSGLAEYVLSQNGLVVGAHFNKESRRVEHIVVNNSNELHLLRLSKYYQSDTQGIYKKTMEALKQEKIVLFSGTACQIAAIKSIVPNKYSDNLITVDVLCHGVSSKKVVGLYIKAQEKKYKKRITDFHFRVKNSIGWDNGFGTRMHLFFENGEEKVCSPREIDTFFLAFNSNSILRESCYVCNFCGTKRISDFTLADFWGVSKKRATNEEKKNGISLLVCNSKKAEEILAYLHKYLKIEKIHSEEAVPYNKAFSSPNTRPANRDSVFSLLNKGKDYNYVMKKIYWNKYIKKSIKNIIGEKTINIIKGVSDE